jgi:hypothetical protein
MSIKTDAQIIRDEKTRGANTATRIGSNLVAIADDLIAKDLALDGKQSTLVSGTNIKTINGSSLLGSGDIVISGGIPTPSEIKTAYESNADTNAFTDAEKDLLANAVQPNDNLSIGNSVDGNKILITPTSVEARSLINSDRIVLEKNKIKAKNTTSASSFTNLVFSQTTNNVDVNFRNIGGDVALISDIPNLIDDDTFATATSTNIASAESIKAYIDANSGGGVSVNDAAYSISWNGETTVAPSKNALYDFIESQVFKVDANSNIVPIFWGGTQAEYNIDFPSGHPSNYFVIITDGAVTPLDASDITIADVGGLITATDVEGALQEHRVLINANNAKVGVTSEPKSDPTGITGADAITNIISLTQAEYDAIGTPNATTLYVING